MRRVAGGKGKGTGRRRENSMKMRTMISMECDSMIFYFLLFYTLIKHKSIRHIKGMHTCKAPLYLQTTLSSYPLYNQ